MKKLIVVAVTIGTLMMTLAPVNASDFRRTTRIEEMERQIEEIEIRIIQIQIESQIKIEEIQMQIQTQIEEIRRLQHYQRLQELLQVLGNSCPD